MLKTDANRRSRRSRRAVRPCLLALESRLALATLQGGVTATLLPDGVLAVQGTSGSDRIQVLPAGSTNAVRILANGRQVGRFDSVASIRIDAGAGNDLVAIDPRVKVASVVDGGAGNDRLRGGRGSSVLLGGEGDDVLVGGAGGFDSLDGGRGRDTISSVGSMGTVWVGPSVSGDAPRVLRLSYTVRPISGATGAATGPIIVGAADLADPATVAQLKAAYDAGRPVGLTRPDEATAGALQAALGHAQSAGISDDGPVPDLVVFRHSTRADGGDNYSSSILDQRTPAPRSPGNALGKRMSDQASTAWLSRAFAAIPVDPAGGAPSLGAGDSPTNDLTKLADSYYHTTLGTNGKGEQLQITNTIWNVRSFTNGNDFYYVKQGIEATVDNGNTIPVVNITNNLDDISHAPTLIDPSPQTTQESRTYTHGLTWNIGGSVGYNAMQGANGALTGGVAVSNSTSYTVPPVIITFSSDLTKGSTKWQYASDPVPSHSTLTFDNDWIWVVPQTAYAQGQTQVQISSQGLLTEYGPLSLPEKTSAGMKYEIPTPFGDVYSFQQPVVSGTNVSSVSSGQNFIINGSGFYSSLVESVELGGNVYTSDQYTVLSDTQIQMTAPYLPGHQDIVVQTQLGRSNSNQSIYINYL